MFLLKPHVVGPEGNITSPDVIVDALFVDGTARPLGLLTHEAWQQATPDLTVQPGYGLMALGGGALILPASVLSSGLVIAARAAWRLENLDAHIGSVTLNATPLAEIALPAHVIEAAGGTGDTLPRGYLLIQTHSVSSEDAVLQDPNMDRSLTQKVHLTALTEDRWGAARPKPRYSVGPTQKEVPHFI